MICYDDNVLCRYKMTYPFPQRIEKDITEFHEKIFIKAMPDKAQRETHLQYQVRGIAGHIEDKEWAKTVGERNSFKGVVGLSYKEFSIERTHIESSLKDFVERTRSIIKLWAKTVNVTAPRTGIL